MLTRTSVTVTIPEERVDNVLDEAHAHADTCPLVAGAIGMAADHVRSSGITELLNRVFHFDWDLNIATSDGARRLEGITLAYGATWRAAQERQYLLLGMTVAGGYEETITHLTELPLGDAMNLDSDAVFLLVVELSRFGTQECPVFFDAERPLISHMHQLTPELLAFIQRCV